MSLTLSSLVEVVMSDHTEKAHLDVNLGKT